MTIPVLILDCLPVQSQPFPSYPVLQVQLYDPTVLQQTT